MAGWIKRECWIAVFDILGFKNMIREADHEIKRAILTERIDELLDVFNSPAACLGKLEHIMVSDTIILLAPNLDAKSYPYFLRQCKDMILKSIDISLPIRGAISTGTSFTSTKPTILIGSAFVDAYEYCEDQDWIGLIITPTATRALRTAGLEPLQHHFVSGLVPLKSKPAEDVVSYRFQEGQSNFKSPLLRSLRNMQHSAPGWKEKEKYERTIKHIREHHRSKRADA